MKRERTEHYTDNQHVVSQTETAFHVFGVDANKTKPIGYLQYTVGEYTVKKENFQLSYDEEPWSKSNCPYDLFPQLDVVTLQVLKDFRGKGIGSALMDAALKYANKCGYPLLIPIETKQYSLDGVYGDATGFYRKYFATRGITLDKYAGGSASGIQIYRIPSAEIANAVRLINLQIPSEEDERATTTTSFTI